MKTKSILILITLLTFFSTSYAQKSTTNELDSMLSENKYSDTTFYLCLTQSYHTDKLAFVLNKYATTYFDEQASFKSMSEFYIPSVYNTDADKLLIQKNKNLQGSYPATIYYFSADALSMPDNLVHLLASFKQEGVAVNLIVPKTHNKIPDSCYNSIFEYDNLTLISALKMTLNQTIADTSDFTSTLLFHTYCLVFNSLDNEGINPYQIKVNNNEPNYPDTTIFNNYLQIIEQRISNKDKSIPRLNDSIFQYFLKPDVYGPEITEVNASQTVLSYFDKAFETMGKLDSLYSLLDDSFRKEKIAIAHQRLHGFSMAFKGVAVGARLIPDCPNVEPTFLDLESMFTDYCEEIQTKHSFYSDAELEKKYYKTIEEIDIIRADFHSIYQKKDN